MTTAVYSRLTKTIAADTQNTDAAGARWRVQKIEHLPGVGVFLGSGHSYTINLAREWAKANWHADMEPDWTYFHEDEDDRGFTCLLISLDGNTVWMIDEELTPMMVGGDHFAIGSGAAYALGALHAGADPVKAVEAAAMYDPNTSAPIDTYTFEE